MSHYITVIFVEKAGKKVFTLLSLGTRSEKILKTRPAIFLCKNLFEIWKLNIFFILRTYILLFVFSFSKRPKQFLEYFFQVLQIIQKFFFYFRKLYSHLASYKIFKNLRNISSTYFFKFYARLFYMHVDGT